MKATKPKIGFCSDLFWCWSGPNEGQIFFEILISLSLRSDNGGCFYCGDGGGCFYSMVVVVVVAAFMLWWWWVFYCGYGDGGGGGFNGGGGMYVSYRRSHRWMAFGFGVFGITKI